MPGDRRRSTPPPRTARSTSYGRTEASSGATTPATRSVPRRSSAELRRASGAGSSTSAPPTGASTRSTPPTAARRWSYDTTPASQALARPQRPQRQPGARPPRHLDRWRGRCHALRPLRLLPRPRVGDDDRCETRPRRALRRRTSRAPIPVTAGGSTELHGYPRRAADGDDADGPARRPPRRRDPAGHDGARAATRRRWCARVSSALRLLRAALGRRSRPAHRSRTASCKPDTKYRVKLAGAYDGGGERQLRRHDHLPDRSARRAPSRSRCHDNVVARLQPAPAGAAAADAAALGRPDRLRQLRLDRRHARADPGRRTAAGAASCSGSSARARTTAAAGVADPASEFAFPLSGRCAGPRSDPRPARLPAALHVRAGAARAACLPRPDERRPRRSARAPPSTGRSTARRCRTSAAALHGGRPLQRRGQADRLGHLSDRRLPGARQPTPAGGQGAARSTSNGRRQAPRARSPCGSRSHATPTSAPAATPPT